jgi:hypothetical protein
MLEWRPGFLGTRNFMCIRGDLPCHIFLYLPATPPSRPVKRVCMAPSFPRNFGTSRFITLWIFGLHRSHPQPVRLFHSKRQKMTKKTKNAGRNRPEKTTPSCSEPDVSNQPFKFLTTSPYEFSFTRRLAANCRSSFKRRRRRLSTHCGKRVKQALMFSDNLRGR